MISFKALGALLHYPSAELQQAVPEIVQALREEAKLPRSLLDAVCRFAAEIAEGDLLEVQERWVWLFDRSRRLALHLHEHSYGESRDRGQAMVDLAMAYRLHGFELASSETPDYLPLFLEFLSQIPEAPARRYLSDATDIIEALRIRLAERDSPYTILLEAVLAFSGRPANEEEVEAILTSEPEDPQDFEQLDRQWAEEAVEFSAGSALGSCPMAGGMARERAAALADSGV